MATGALTVARGCAGRRPDDGPTGAVAFTDLVGFTDFTARRGDGQALALLDRHERTTRAALPAGARVVKNLGDGHLLWFPDGAGAVETCLRLVEGSAAGGGPRLRAGLHWGRPTRRGADLVGHAVNVAARVVDLAGPGELLVTEAAWAAAGSVEGIAFDRRGRLLLRGVPEPLEVLAARRGLVAPSTPGCVPQVHHM